MLHGVLRSGEEVIQMQTQASVEIQPYLGVCRGHGYTRMSIEDMVILSKGSHVDCWVCTVNNETEKGCRTEWPYTV